jgi:hypothetical protein
MRKKFPIRLILVPAVIGVVAWWLWPAAQQDDLAEQNKSSLGGRGLVSAVQPVSQSFGDGNLGSSGDYKSTPISVLDDAEKKTLSANFQKAQQAYEQGNQPRAIEILSQLTIDHPHIIEPYVNLAAAYAADGQLEQARLTLNRGVDVNKTYARLFENLRRVHGALAANAYRSALDQEEELVSKVELPILNEVSLVPSGQQMVALLQQRESEFRTRLEVVSKELQDSKNSLELAQTQSAETNDTQTMVASLQQQLSQSQLELANLKESGVLVASLDQGGVSGSLPRSNGNSVALENEEKLRLKQKQLEDQQVAERELAARKLAEQEQARLALLSSEKEQERKDKLIADAKLSEEQAQAVQDQRAQNQLAISLVKSWADAWSGQNVSSYVSHYRDGYVPPGSSITHATWLEQRQVRLTNKKFINVGVSNFEVRNSGDKFFVTFSQHYQSNTMDDTIRKQLQFQKMGDDWRQAKIIGERVVR